jgi:phosphoribosyl 1,2-cyclic phosphate phosphodiesterase
VIFLGTGASCGVPSFYCGCKACQEALEIPSAQRSCSALLIVGQQHTLIDAGPEIRTQLNRARISRVDQILLTHEHFDHIGGIPQFEYYVRLGTQKPLAVYGSPVTLEAVRQQFGFMLEALDLRVLKPWQTLALDTITYTALPAEHSPDALGFLLELQASGADKGASSRRLAYFPDTGPLRAEVLERLRGVDILVIDATFNGNNWMPNSHHSIGEAIALAQNLGAKQSYLTHLSMHYDQPITQGELSAWLASLPWAVAAAQDGLVLRF